MILFQLILREAGKEGFPLIHVFSDFPIIGSNGDHNLNSKYGFS